MAGRLFLDLDGVLADLRRGYEHLLGPMPDRTLDDADWLSVRATAPLLFAELPSLPDAWDLWKYAAPFNPTILTAIPKTFPEAAVHKRYWVRTRLGPDVKVVCCSEKYKYANPGSILVDDWEDMHRQRWEQAGGIFITHRNARKTIGRLRQIFGN